MRFLILLSSPLGVALSRSVCPAWIYWLVGMILLQVCILILQEQIGPSFFLPKTVSTPNSLRRSAEFNISDTVRPRPKLRLPSRFSNRRFRSASPRKPRRLRNLLGFYQIATPIGFHYFFEFFSSSKTRPPKQTRDAIQRQSARECFGRLATPSRYGVRCRS